MPRIQIRDAIAEFIQDNVSGVKIFLGRNVSIDKFPASERSRLIQVVISGENYGNETTSSSAHNVYMPASLSLEIVLYSKGSTEIEFDLFIDEVRDAFINKPNDLYQSDLSRVENISLESMVMNSDSKNQNQLDELRNTNERRLDVQAAAFEVEVEYSFITKNDRSLL